MRHCRGETVTKIYRKIPPLYSLVTIGPYTLKPVKNFCKNKIIFVIK